MNEPDNPNAPSEDEVPGAVNRGDEDMEEMSEADSDHEGDEYLALRERLFRVDRRMPEFLRMLAPLQVANGSAAADATNERLVQQLSCSSALKCKRVIKAFQVVSRDLFVPDDQLAEAFIDRPLRLDNDFNISAPHMHACMTEALNLESGDAVLDVGSGCGFTTAICAFLVGPGGRVTGLEVRDIALQLAAKGIEAVMAKPEFSRNACVPTFEKCNAFIAPHHEGIYDKVHVGGSIPDDKVHVLLRLLKPDAGILVVPVGQNLLRFTRKDGKVTKEVLAAVRFGELEVPADSAIVLGHLECHRHKLSSPPKEHSPYQNEMAAALFGSSPLPELVVEEKDDEHSSMCGCSGILGSPSSVPSATLHRKNSPLALWFRARLTRSDVRHAASRPRRLASSSSSGSGSGSSVTLPTSLEGVLESLGPADCTIVGTNFEFPAHRAVLKERCMLLRARFASGMADSNDNIVRMPAHFDAATVQLCLDHLYRDDVSLDDSNAVNVLHAASYLGVPHLVSLCQAFIISHLQTQPLAEAVDSAAELQMYASENGLDTLRAFCASFQAMHIGLARVSPGYARLGARELDEIIRALASEHDVIVSQLQQLSRGATAGPTSRRGSMRIALGLNDL